MAFSSFQRLQAQTAQGVVLLVGRQWDRLGSLDDWPTIAERVTLLTAAGQMDTARRGIAYAAEVLDEEPVGMARPAGAAGVFLAACLA